MSTPVSPWVVAFPFSNQESGEVLVYRRSRRSSFRMRKVVRPRGARPTTKLLAAAESAPALAKTVPAPAKSEIVEACPFDAGITPHALLVFGAFHAVPLLGWALSDAPWTWRSAAALVAVGAALVLSAALRRGPSRRLVVCGLGVALVSFSRMVGVDWTLSTWAAFLPTAALAIVLARAAIPPALVAWLSSRMLREAR